MGEVEGVVEAVVVLDVARAGEGVAGASAVLTGEDDDGTAVGLEGGGERDLGAARQLFVGGVVGVEAGTFGAGGGAPAVLGLLQAGGGDGFEVEPEEMGEGGGVPQDVAELFAQLGLPEKAVPSLSPAYWRSLAMGAGDVQQMVTGMGEAWSGAEGAWPDGRETDLSVVSLRAATRALRFHLDTLPAVFHFDGPGDQFLAESAFFPRPLAICLCGLTAGVGDGRNGGGGAGPESVR